MKVLLTHGYFISEDEKEKTIMKPYPPLGILYIAAWLERHGIQCQVYDTTFSTKAELKLSLEKSPPILIGIYTNLMTKLNIVEIISYIKNYKVLQDSIIVIGGPDTRHNINDYLNIGADIVVFGEGEQTMLEIVKSVKAGNIEQYGHIDGLAYKYGSNIIKTKERNRIRPIDDIPNPARHKIDMQPYLDTWQSNHGISAMTISTQRGCPYTCKWCSTAVYGQSYRRRSPQKVVEELTHLIEEYNPDSFWFVDDVFTVSHKWLKDFRDIIQERNLQLNYECITRADRMNEDVIMWLKESGCFRVWIGAESGSQKVIDLMDRRVDVHQVRRMIQLSNKQGIETGTFIMLGYPGETEEDIIETLNHLKESEPTHYTITVAYPIKGTGLYEQIDIEQNESLNWNHTTDRDRNVIRQYSKSYYRFAMGWIREELALHKKIQNNSSLTSPSLLRHVVRSWIYRSGMRILKRI